MEMGTGTAGVRQGNGRVATRERQESGKGNDQRNVKQGIQGEARGTARGVWNVESQRQRQ